MTREQRGEECGAVSASELFWCTGFVVIRSELWNCDSEFREVPARLGMARRQLPASGNPPLKEQSSPSDGSPPQRYNRPLTFDVIELLWSSEVVSETVMWVIVVRSAPAFARRQPGRR